LAIKKNEKIKIVYRLPPPKRKNEVMPFAVMMDLEIIVLSEVRQRQKSNDIAYM